MNTAIYWFRNDFRLEDNPALAAACASGDRLMLLAVTSPAETENTRWGFPRWGDLRRTFRDQALEGLKIAVARRGGQLRIEEGPPVRVLSALAREVGAERVFCESIAAPEEVAEIAALREANLDVHAIWQSSLLDPDDLPFAVKDTPAVFTAFRHAIENSDPRVPPPIPAPSLPSNPAGIAPPWSARRAPMPRGDASFPFDQPAFHGTESAALAHLERYFGSATPQSYKVTRNRLSGIDFSTKLSPWLGVGALSPRTVYAYLRAHEARFGANESTYWIWFELLWRDFFRFSTLKHGAQLFHARGLGRQPPPTHDPQAFAHWCTGRTGQPFVDAGMRELAATGYLSNRMRQIVASYLVHDLDCDFRAGAAWFESQLIDFDVCSNQGNWLYIAGRGADPRGGRQFNPDKQAAMYDSDCAYRQRWTDEA